MIYVGDITQQDFSESILVAGQDRFCKNMLNEKLCIYFKFVTLKVCFALITIVLIYNAYSMLLYRPVNVETDRIITDEYDIPWILDEKQEEFEIEMVSDDCFDHVPMNIEEFSTIWKDIKTSRSKKCEGFRAKFEKIYEFEERFSKSMVIPPMLQAKLKLSLNEKDFTQINHQKIISVFNRLTFEQTVFNPLRSRRPLPKEGKSIWEYVDSLALKSKLDCDFCNYIKKTATDEFGRHDTLFTVRMSNSFKMDRWHGMVLAKNHHPVNITINIFEAMLDDAYTWTKEIQHVDPTYLYPNLGMDTLPKAGASQVHPHLHIMMSPSHYYGSMEILRSVSYNYLKQTERGYFHDLIQLYSALGLAIRYKSAVALSMLTSKGDMEILIMSDKPNKDLYNLLYFVIKAYRDSYHQVCYSTSMAWPPVISSDKLFEIPALIRIMSRGNCQTNLNDISNFDLYMMNSRTHDPWDVARAVQKSVDDNNVI